MLKNYVDNLTIKVAFDSKKIPRKLVFAGFGFLLGVNDYLLELFCMK